MSLQEKTLNWLSLINHQPDIDKTYLYAKDPFDAKHHLLTNKRENVSSKHLDDHKAFIEYQNYMDDTYENINDCNTIKKSKIVIAFD